MAKPKLELQINIPTLMRLLQTEPASGESNYGKWFLYSVECNRQEYSFFAPEKVVEFFKKNNVGQDDEVVITKKLIKKGSKNLTDYEIQIIESKVPALSGNYSNGITNGVSNGNGHSMVTTNGVHQNAIETAPAISRDYKMMLQCLTEAMMLRDELGQDIDLNKIGITLYLRKVKP